MAYSKKIPHGIMFHHFHNEKHLKTQGSISSDDFKKILDYIGLERVLSPLEWLERLSENKLRPEDLCLTFDDGLLSQIDVALPVLESYGLKAFWFVYSGVFSDKDGPASLAGQAGGEIIGNLEIYRLFRTKYFDNLEEFYRAFFKEVLKSGLVNGADPESEEKTIGELRKIFPFYSKNDAKFRFLRDRALGKENYEKLMSSMMEEYGAVKSDLAKNLWMSDKNLKQLSDAGHLIGLHSYSHPTALADLSYKSQFEEYQKNYLHLERVCGQKPLAMSHPCNSYNEDTLKILKELGIYCGFQSNMFSGKIGKSSTNCDLEIAREDHANITRALR
ncbi:MAG: polysaccharide deacetylase family protein [bacterium]|nr:polysaccharide deacetylase family protein [bacterium]